MLQHLRDTCASVLLRPPFRPRRWQEYLGIHAPILAPALHDSAYARLLTFRTLDAIHRRKPSRLATNRLKELHSCLCTPERPADQALYSFLAGMYTELLGKPDEMAFHFQVAARLNAAYHLIYAKLGEYYTYARGRYDLAVDALDQAIDCVYKYPPLDEPKRLVIAVLQSGIAYALLMLHCTDEAEAALTKSAPAAAMPSHLHAKAFLCAIQGRHDEAHATLSALRSHNARFADICKENIQLILDGTHPHFTAKEPDHAAIAAYWEWFRQAEADLRRHLLHGRSDVCFKLHEQHFAPLAPESGYIDHLSSGLLLVGGKLQIHLHDLHSKTYAALLDAFTAACPPDIRSRWEIVRNPSDVF